MTLRARARSMICVRLFFISANRQPAETVVGAEREDQDPDVPLERPIQPAQAARGRVAGDASVDDLDSRSRRRRSSAGAGPDRPASPEGPDRRSGCRPGAQPSVARTQRMRRCRRAPVSPPPAGSADSPATHGTPRAIPAGWRRVQGSRGRAVGVKSWITKLYRPDPRDGGSGFVCEHPQLRSDMSLFMARGWESKSVESQQDDAARGKMCRPALTPEEQERLVRRRTLELSRARLAGGSGPRVSSTPSSHARARAGGARCAARIAQVTRSAEYILLALSRPGWSPDGA